MSSSALIIIFSFIFFGGVFIYFGIRKKKEVAGGLGVCLICMAFVIFLSYMDRAERDARAMQQYKAGLKEGARSADIRWRNFFTRQIDYKNVPITGHSHATVCVSIYFEDGKISNWDKEATLLYPVQPLAE